MMNRCRVVMAALFLLVLLTMMRLAASRGADGEQYEQWANAIVQNDIFVIKSEVVTPWGVPFSHWPSGVGLVYSLSTVIQDAVLSSWQPSGATGVLRGYLFMGWLFSVITLLGLGWVIYRLSNRSRVLTYFGLALSLVATPLGYYSVTYASETLTLTCLVLGWLLLLYVKTWGTRETCVVGCLTALFMMIRQNQALYLVPFLAALAWQILHQELALPQKFRRLFVLALPIVAALFQIGISNWWMTGSFLRFPQQWGDERVSSMDFSSPEMLATLVHPWHGLLIYHPFYVLAAVAFGIAWINSTRSRGTVPGPYTYGFLAAGIGINLIFTAAFYTWWCGEYSFGSRGMAPCSVILLPIFIHVLARVRNSRVVVIWVLAAMLCALWSFFLMRLNETQFYQMSDLIHGTWDSARQFLHGARGVNALAVSLMVILSVVCLAITSVGRLPMLCVVCGNLMMLLTFIYLQQQMDGSVISPRYVAIAASPMMTLLAALVLAVISPCFINQAHARPEHESPWPLRMATWTAVTGFVLVFLAFVPFAITTQCELAAGRRAPREHFQYEATFHVVDCMLSAEEYQKVPGFDVKKRLIREFIDEQASRTRIASSVTGSVE